MSRGETDDLDLLRLAAEGDEDAFGEIVARHQSAVWRFACSLARNAETAEDILQETFLSIWRGAGAFRGEASVRTWIFAIARNSVYRHYRTTSMVDEVSLGELGSAAGWGDAEAFDMSAAQLDRRILVSRALEALSAMDREVLLLRDVEGFSGEETAEMLGLTLAATKTRLHRARLRFAAEARRRTSDA